MGNVLGFGASLWVATEWDNLPHAHAPIFIGNRIDFFLWCADAGQVRSGPESCLGPDILDHLMGTFSGRSVGTIGDRDKFGTERLQSDLLFSRD